MGTDEAADSEAWRIVEGIATNACGERADPFPLGKNLFYRLEGIEV